jgi:hypothetical protein
LTDIQKIPGSLAVFFQEVELDQLDLDRDAAIIMERTLRYGNRVELRWLFARYGRTAIADWIREMGAYRLPERHLAFWCLLLDIETVARPQRKAIWPH